MPDSDKEVGQVNLVQLSFLSSLFSSLKVKQTLPCVLTKLLEVNFNYSFVRLLY